MERSVIILKSKKVIWSILSYAIITLIYFGLLLIYLFHRIITFFPVLFLFDFSLLVGYPLFLRFVLKRKWFDCTKNDYLLLKYILIPWLILELLVMLYYPNETWLILQQIVKG